jgi:hypothetical protein
LIAALQALIHLHEAHPEWFPSGPVGAGTVLPAAFDREKMPDLGKEKVKF